MGIRVILAESFSSNYERSLIEVGILPLRFAPGQSAMALNISGKETFSFVFKDENEKVGCGWESGSGSVEVRLNDGRRFHATSSFASESAMKRVANGGFFPQAMDYLMA